MFHQAALSALAAWTLVLGAAGAPQAPSTELKPSDHEKLAGFIAEALDPKNQDLKKKDKTAQALRDFLEKAGKTRNPKDPLQGGLALTGDLSRGLYLSADYKMANVNRGSLDTTTLEPKTPNAVDYTLWVPKGYKVEQSFPLILCLPGMRESKVLSPEEYFQDNWLDPAVREKALIAAVKLPDDAKSWTENVTEDGKPGGVAVLMLTLRDIRSRYAVDFDRIYLCGRESAVGPALTLANKFPHLFAGVIGRSGDAGEVSPANFRALPTYFTGGGSQVAAFEEGVKKLGYNNATVKSDGTDADVLAWMMDHPRQANPSKVTLVPGKPIPTRAYWLRVPPTDAGTDSVRVDGEIDRTKNTITITGTGVRQVTLMLNDVLVDLDKPVTVVLNGTPQEVLLPRSLEDTLAMMYDGASEPGRVYVVRKEFDLPVAK